MNDEEARLRGICVNCGYCKHCGRSDEVKPEPIEPPAEVLNHLCGSTFNSFVCDRTGGHPGGHRQTTRNTVTSWG